jgi:hypothetical protein
MSWPHQFTAFRVTSGVMTDGGMSREPDVIDQGPRDLRGLRLGAPVVDLGVGVDGVAALVTTASPIAGGLPRHRRGGQLPDGEPAPV